MTCMKNLRACILMMSCCPCCLQEGIDSFAADQVKLEAMIAELKENPEYPA